MSEAMRTKLQELVEAWRENEQAIGPRLEGAAFNQCANDLQFLLDTGLPIAEVEAHAPQEQAVIAELAAHIQTARRALADPRTERSILSAGVALDEAFQVLEGRPPVVEARAPQEPSPSERVEQALRLAEQATNGWACYAKRKIEHDDIARLHSAIAALRATPPAAADGRDTPPRAPMCNFTQWTRRQGFPCAELYPGEQSKWCGTCLIGSQNSAGGDTPQEPPPALEIMLRELRERGANRGEPCGVHDSPQWTCAFCLHNLLAVWEMTQIKSKLEAREARAVPPLDWHPIATAPKDEAVLVFCPPNSRCVARRGVYRYGFGGAFVSIPGSYSVKPTHWMPLPALPQDQP